MRSALHFRERYIARVAHRVEYERRCGFTLVELLVVIAIIGILVSLLLPAIQAARESGRRITCTNQVHQMIVAMHNHVDTYGVFPTGGVEPWPEIEDYSRNGKPFSVDKQGLSWAFQILPFLEQNAVHNLATTQQLTSTPIGLYFCPSRRSPVKNLITGRWLMDYAGVVPIPSVAQLPGLSGPNAFRDSNDDGILNFCGGTQLWHRVNDFNPMPVPANFASDSRYQYWGVLVRSTLFREEEGEIEVRLNYTGPVGFRHITDGASNTAVVTEKRINPETYLTGSGPPDDRGWSDGWDYDTLRLTACIPYPDSSSVREFTLTAGSAHPAGINTGFADGAVKMISYDIDPEIFNLLAHRTDDQIVDLDQL